MDARKDALPEGTDAILDTDQVAEDITETSNAARRAAAQGLEAAASSARAAMQKMSEATAGLRDQAAERAHDLASQSKDRAAQALDGVTRLVGEAAGKLDDNVGEQYGAYARRAADAMQGFAATLRSSEVEDLLRSARDTVRKNPVIAISAAAAAGFVLARLLRAGTAAAGEPEETPAPTTKASRKKSD